MNNIQLLFIRFENALSFYEVEYFRGAVISSLQDKDILFHNHLPNDNGFRYSYPVIQYKRINQKAAIMCFNSGTESIGKFFFDSDLTLKIGDRLEKFVVHNIKAYRHLTQIWDTSFRYRIRKWLALNQENYEKYSQLEGVAEKTLFLENILRANILSFAKGLYIFFEKQVACKIMWLSMPTIISYKGIKMMMFDAEFTTNVSIPDYAGLGKGVSIGFGNTVRKRESKNK